MTHNINEYNQRDFESSFRNTAVYQQLTKDFDVIDFNKSWKDPDDWFLTPRQISGTGRASNGPTMFSAVPFYYLQYLVSAEPEIIYDIGCGWNIFKKYLHNVIGIGPDAKHCGNFYGDIYDYVDDEFVSGHQDYFESAFSINALHFHPLSSVQKVVTDFVSMLRPGGIGWLALNSARMVELDSKRFGHTSQPELDAFVRKELASIDVEFLVYDVDLTSRDDKMNGNIRLVMRKTLNHA